VLVALALFLLLARSGPGGYSGEGTVERANHAVRVLVDRIDDGLDPWFTGSSRSGTVSRYGDYK
jgi:hypothetical protein